MYSHGRHLPYAPSPHSYTPYTTLSATISLDEELKPPTHPAERDLHDSLAEIYSIIVTLDGLEKAFNKDSVTEAEYTEICSRLLKQYQSTLSDERVEREFGDLDTFKARWHIDCPRATERLKLGLPSTLTHPAPTGGGTHPHPNPHPAYPYASPHPAHASHAAPTAGAASAQSYIAATEAFITFLDALKLGMRSKAELHPLLSEVIQSANAATGGREFDGKASIVKWLIRLNGMRVQDCLGEEEGGELAFELAAAYEGFKGSLG